MSQAKIYVGNLPYSASNDQLQDIFTQYGSIVDIKIISDYETGRSKGFGFITFSSDEEAQASLAANGTELDSRPLKVNIARDNPRGGSGGGRRQGGFRETSY